MNVALKKIGYFWICSLQRRINTSGCNDLHITLAHIKREFTEGDNRICDTLNQSIKMMMDSCEDPSFVSLFDNIKYVNFMTDEFFSNKLKDFIIGYSRSDLDEEDEGDEEDEVDEEDEREKLNKFILNAKYGGVTIGANPVNNELFNYVDTDGVHVDSSRINYEDTDVVHINKI